LDSILQTITDQSVTISNHQLSQIDRLRLQLGRLSQVRKEWSRWKTTSIVYRIEAVLPKSWYIYLPSRSNQPNHPMRYSWRQIAFFSRDSAAFSVFFDDSANFISISTFIQIDTILKDSFNRELPNKLIWSLTLIPNSFIW